MLKLFDISWSWPFKSKESTQPPTETNPLSTVLERNVPVAKLQSSNAISISATAPQSAQPQLSPKSSKSHVDEEILEDVQSDKTLNQDPKIQGLAIQEDSGLSGASSQTHTGEDPNLELADSQYSFSATTVDLIDDSNLPKVAELSRASTQTYTDEESNLSLVDNQDSFSATTVDDSSPLDQEGCLVDAATNFTINVSKLVRVCPFCQSKRNSMADEPHKNMKGCTGCKIQLCDFHWDTLDSHNPQIAPDEELTKHRKLNSDDYKPVEDLLKTQKVDEDTLAKDHQDDTRTTWFGVEADEACKDDPKLVKEMSTQDSASEENHEKNISTFKWTQTQRFKDLFCSTQREWDDDQFPRLISFVGRTGVGKSFLIKSLMLFGTTNVNTLDATTQTPIPAASTSPGTATSYNVHMYADEKVLRDRYPTVYVDSEGLDGGSIPPTASRLVSKIEMEQKGSSKKGHRISEFMTATRQMYGTSTRKDFVSSTDYKTTRETYVDEIYPRILYSLSDVICFVTDTPNSPEIIFRKLICWADGAVTAAVNQMVLPYAIIVLNCPKLHQQDLLDPEEATNKILGLKDKMPLSDSTLQEMASKWSKISSKPIKTLFDLLLCYFRDVKVVYTTQLNNESIGVDVFKKQITRLQKCIQETSSKCHETKYHKFQLLSARQFSYVSDEALSYFSSNLSESLDKREPFDILRTIAKRETAPQGFTEHFVNLMEKLEKVFGKTGPANFWDSKDTLTLGGSLQMSNLDKAAVEVVWSALVAHPGYTNAITTQTLEMLGVAYRRYYKMLYPCAKNGCVNLESGHAKGHQKSSGEIFEKDAAFIPVLSPESPQRFINAIKAKLHETQALKDPPEPAKQHAQNILNNSEFLKKISTKKSCFMCLRVVPDYCLPCDHTLCEVCIRRYGKPDERDLHTFSFPKCPLGCEEGSGDQFNWSIHLKPPTAGARVLTLDGGGVRGIVTARILSELEKELGLNLPIHRYFDLVVGTSTGGILALALGDSCIKAKEAESLFTAFAEKIFQDGRIKRATRLIGFESRYLSGPIENHLQKTFGEKHLFSSRGPYVSTNNPPPKRIHSGLRLAVTATTSHSTKLCVMSNYTRKFPVDGYADFYREEDDNKEIETWKAARCTSAAPSYFPPFKASNGTFYEDGAIKANCPVTVARREHSILWPYPQMDRLVSVGTGFTEEKHDNGARRHVVIRVRKALGRNFNAEAQWNEIKDQFDENRVHRHTVKLAMEVKLNDASKIKYLQDQTTSQYEDNSHGRRELRNTAKGLISALFYVEFLNTTRKYNQADQTFYKVTGEIHCRLHPTEVNARTHLADKLRCKKYKFCVRVANTSDKPEVPPNCEVKKKDDLVWEVNFDTLDVNNQILIELEYRAGSQEEQCGTLISGMPQKIEDFKPRNVFNINLEVQEKKLTQDFESTD